jgi:pimeloyl-ACP methyl ester carboxylesterase
VGEEIRIPAGGLVLPGDLVVPEGARAVVVFAHGSGSSRLSPRNLHVASTLRRSGTVGTLLFDLLTEAEDSVYANRFDIDLLARRLEAAMLYLQGLPEFAGWPLGLFGASTGAAAAIIAAVRAPEHVRAVVSRGGRPDLAAAALDRLTAPTLLIVGANDHDVVELNRRSLERIPAPVKRLELVPGATHLFEEAGTLDSAANLASGWFERYLI